MDSGAQEVCTEVRSDRLLAALIVVSSLLFVVLLTCIIYIWRLRVSRKENQEATERVERLNFHGWDVEAFHEDMRKSDVAFVPVGYIRKLHAQGHKLPRRDEAKDVIVKKPPDWSSIFVVLWVWGAEDHPDPDCMRLARIVELLHDAYAGDDDLIFLDYISLPPPATTHCSLSDASIVTRKRLRLKERRMSKRTKDAQNAQLVLAAAEAVAAAGLSSLEAQYAERTLECSFLFTERRPRTIVLTENECPGSKPFVERMGKMACLHCAAFCGRIVNMSDVLEIILTSMTELAAAANPTLEERRRYFGGTQKDLLQVWSQREESRRRGLSPLSERSRPRGKELHPPAIKQSPSASSSGQKDAIVSFASTADMLRASVEAARKEPPSSLASTAQLLRVRASREAARVSTSTRSLGSTVASNGSEGRRQARASGVAAFLAARRRHKKSKEISFGDSFFKIVRALAPKVAPVRNDAEGFEDLCTFAQIAWLKVSYVRHRASKPGPSPFPRRQDLQLGAFYLGAPPSFARKFVVSHAWASERHPSPSGNKMWLIAQQLNALDPPAADDDCVFLDYCSLPQYGHKVPAAYYTCNGLQERAELEQRTLLEERLFRRALSGMTQLYAFHGSATCKGCEVIVIPDHEDVADGDGWGNANGRAYANRGWCATEFATAYFADTIANLSSPKVAAVETMREWPSTVVEYELMMNDEASIQFTGRGDRDVTRHIFFRCAYTLDGEHAAHSLITHQKEQKQRIADTLSDLSIHRRAARTIQRVARGYLVRTKLTNTVDLSINVDGAKHKMLMHKYQRRSRQRPGARAGQALTAIRLLTKMRTRKKANSSGSSPDDERGESPAPLGVLEA